jgi:hypothetical protein
VGGLAPRSALNRYGWTRGGKDRAQRKKKSPVPKEGRSANGRRRDALLHALFQNGWILAGVLALGWSASVALGGIYLETLFGSVALQRAVRRAGRAHIAMGEWIRQDGVAPPETLGDSTRTTTLIGLAQGAFLLVFGAGALLHPEGLDPIWRLSLGDLGSAAAGALMTSVVEYRRLRQPIAGAGDAWLRSRADLQFSTTLALVLFMMVLPWTFFLVGERGLFVVLIGGKAGLDTWLAGRRPEGESLRRS